MKQKLLLIGFFLSAFFGASAQFSGSAIDAKLTENKKALGEDAVTLIYKDGKVIYKKKLTDEFDEKTPSPIGGGGRWLTAALVMQFIDEGKLSLDTKIADYLPIYATYGKKYITIRHCLADLVGIEAKKWSVNEPGKFETLEAMVNDYAKKEIRANTGTDFWYSNMGINIAARVCEVVSKKGFEQLISQKLLRPLGMKVTTFTPEGNRCVNPGADAVTSANDYMNFLIMLLNKGSFNGKNILSATSVEQLLLPQMTTSMIAYAPKGATDIEFGLGGCVLNKDTDGKTTVAACPNFMGFWPVVDYCRGYALIIFPKNYLVDSKKEIYTSIKDNIENQLTSICK